MQMKKRWWIYLSVTPVFRNGCGRFRRRRTGHPGNGHVAGSAAASAAASDKADASSSSAGAASAAGGGVVAIVVVAAAAARAARRCRRVAGCAAAGAVADPAAAATTAAAAPRSVWSIRTGTSSSLSLGAFAQHRGPKNNKRKKNFLNNKVYVKRQSHVDFAIWAQKPTKKKTHYQQMRIKLAQGGRNTHTSNWLLLSAKAIQMALNWPPAFIWFHGAGVAANVRLLIVQNISSKLPWKWNTSFSTKYQQGPKWTREMIRHHLFFFWHKSLPLSLDYDLDPILFS